jgi:hypothetical protein
MRGPRWFDEPAAADNAARPSSALPVGRPLCSPGQPAGRIRFASLRYDDPPPRFFDLPAPGSLPADHRPKSRAAGKRSIATARATSKPSVAPSSRRTDVSLKTFTPNYTAVVNAPRVVGTGWLTPKALDNGSVLTRCTRTAGPTSDGERRRLGMMEWVALAGQGKQAERRAAQAKVRSHHLPQRRSLVSVLSAAKAAPVPEELPTSDRQHTDMLTIAQGWRWHS